jgi:hypothetical protein
VGLAVSICFSLLPRLGAKLDRLFRSALDALNVVASFNANKGRQAA